ncbi:PEP-CTERM motif protein [Posidoniimonas corsicana]|uniref:PEP-CTERM motif protein n=1 Tax=Posidoniimonas corsicana TaxID=1938618 RepID=A0A5C5VD96_9BACT|nr:hypothetical protein [Posidoniimonas corsicana]TWT36594.1 PEP-CTERM motif protein [Posidoniimonas corsicana]
MDPKTSSRFSPLAWSLAAVLLTSSARAQSIGVTFGADDAGSTGGNSALAPAEVAGVVPQANWNNAEGITATITDAVDSAGAASTLDVTWSAEESWSGVGGTPATPNGKLLNGWISENLTDAAPSTVTISQIPYSQYDMIFYLAHDRGGAGENTIFSEAGGAFADFNARENVTGTTVAADPFQFDAVPFSGGTGNFFVATGLTQSSLSIEFGSANDRAPFSGFQLVNTVGQLAGDVDGDGSVDFDDYDIIESNMFQRVGSRSEGDLNYDLTVDFEDFRIWKADVAAGVVGGDVTAPEPAAACLALLGGLGLLASRSRRSLMSGQVLAASFLAVGLSASGANAQSVGVNFGADDAGTTGAAALSAVETAGVVPQANWNNAEGGSGAITDAVDSSGAATTLDVEWASEESWSGAGAAPVVPDGVLMNGWISENGADSEPSTISISEIPYDKYNLILYVGHDRGDEDTSFTETGGAFTDFLTLESIDATSIVGDPFVFTEITASGGIGTHFVTRGLTQSSLGIEFAVANGERAPVTGFQIVAIPEPGALCLAILGGLGVFASRSKRRLSACSVVLAALVVTGLSTQQVSADSVGVSFGADDAGSTGGLSTLAPADTAGVVPQTNWNNASGISGTITNAVDDSGAASTIDVTWASEESWSGAGTPAGTEGKLFNGWISENAGEDGLPSTITIDQIPYEKYDLIIYVGHDRANDDTVFTETGGAFTDFITLEGIDGTTIAADPFAYTEITESGATGTHFVTRALSQSSLSIEFSAGTASADRGPVSGFQIIDNPFPLGDVNMDLVVDIDDLDIIRANFFMTDAVPGDGDVNLDKRVDWTDFKLWKANATPAALAAIVPEPHSLTLCAVSLLGLHKLGRRRPRQPSEA